MSRNKITLLTPKFTGPSNETLVKRAEQTRSQAEKYALAVMSELGIETGMRRYRLSMGPIKTGAAIDRKAHSQYGGDRSKVLDTCRLRIFTQIEREMENAIKLFVSGIKTNRFHSDIAKKSGTKHRKDPKDYVSTPKRWGWMGLQLKMETTLSKGQTGLFEVQIFPESMKGVYDVTHKLYADIKTALEDWEKTTGSVHEVLTPDQVATVEEILKLHRNGAESCGLIKLCKTGFPRLSDPPPAVKEEDIPPFEVDESAEFSP